MASCQVHSLEVAVDVVLSLIAGIIMPVTTLSSLEYIRDATNYGMALLLKLVVYELFYQDEAPNVIDAATVPRSSSDCIIVPGSSR